MTNLETFEQSPEQVHLLLGFDADGAQVYGTQFYADRAAAIAEANNMALPTNYNTRAYVASIDIAELTRIDPAPGG